MYHNSQTPNLSRAINCTPTGTRSESRAIKCNSISQQFLLAPPSSSLTSDNTLLSDHKTTLSEDVKSYVKDAISPNTKRAYKSDLNHFENWGGIIPASEEMVASYLADHATSLAIATLQRRLASISTAHGAIGEESPTSSKLVQTTMRGIRKRHGKSQKQAKPLLVEDLMRIMPLLGTSLKDTRDKALLLIGFAGGFRRSELVGLNVEDIETARQGLIVTITRSKTDQTGEGRKIGIPFARGAYCPALAFDAWMKRANITEGPFFCPVTRHGEVKGKRLSNEAVSKIVKHHAKRIGLDPIHYSGHSLRSGLATSAAQAGVSTIAIRQQTGHKSDAMLNRYVRAGELFNVNATRFLL